MLFRPQLNIKWNTFSESQKAFTFWKGLEWRWRWYRNYIFSILSRGTRNRNVNMSFSKLSLFSINNLPRNAKQIYNIGDLPYPPLLLKSHHSPPAFILTRLEFPKLKADININSLWWCFPIQFIMWQSLSSKVPSWQFMWYLYCSVFWFLISIASC